MTCRLAPHSHMPLKDLEGSEFRPIFSAQLVAGSYQQETPVPIITYDHRSLGSQVARQTCSSDSGWRHCATTSKSLGMTKSIWLHLAMCLSPLMVQCYLRVTSGYLTAHAVHQLCKSARGSGKVKITLIGLYVIFLFSIFHPTKYAPIDFHDFQGSTTNQSWWDLKLSSRNFVQHLGTKRFLFRFTKHPLGHQGMACWWSTVTSVRIQRPEPSLTAESASRSTWISIHMRWNALMIRRKNSRLVYLVSDAVSVLVVSRTGEAAGNPLGQIIAPFKYCSSIVAFWLGRLDLCCGPKTWIPVPFSRFWQGKNAFPEDISVTSENPTRFEP